MRILVADDEKDMALVLQAILEREHHTVDVAYDGRAALDFARTGELAAISNLTAISGAVMGLSSPAWSPSATASASPRARSEATWRSASRCRGRGHPRREDPARRGRENRPARRWRRPAEGAPHPASV